MYVYAFCPEATPLPPLPQGIDHPLQTVSAAGVTAIGELPLDLDALQQDEARLVSAVVHHDWALCELIQSVTLLPLRFGTQFKDLNQLRSHLQAQAIAYRTQLTALQDKVEICLKLHAKPIPPSVSTPTPSAAKLSAPTASTPTRKGRDYFLAKKQRLKQQALTEAQQNSQLAQLQESIIRSYPQHQLETDRVYVLIHRQAMEQLHEQQQHWQQQFPSCEVQLSGILPPYHFIELV